MNEENSLGFEIRARVLPMLEGADQLIQQVQALPAQMSSRMNQTVQSPAFQEGLTPQQIQKVENFASGKDVYEFQKIQEHQRQFAEDLDIDISSGRITKSTKGKWQKKFRRQGGMIEGFAEDSTEQLNEPYFDFLGPDKKKMLMSALSEGTREATDNVEKLNREFERVADNINKSSTEARSFFDQMKAAGVLTLAGSVINMGLDYWTRGEQIKGAERTSFDFSNPMSMYAQQKQFEAYKTTTERMRDYEINGAGIGLAGGLGLAAIAGVTGGVGLLAAGAAGLYFGQSIGGKIASGKNIETESEMQEQLKRRQEVYEQLNSMVEGSASYDILRSRTRARIGTEAIEEISDLGYSPTEELQMRNTFADTRGKFDPQLYKEQTTFARSEGIDANAIYQMNLTARMTNWDVGINGLDQARQLARMTYGENFSNQRVVDILNDIKNINERLLQTNVDLSSRDALRISVIPSLIFGNDSAYGRPGEKAEDTRNILRKFGEPSSLAQEAFLFSAYGVRSPLDFLERERKGALDPENFEAIVKGIRNVSGGNKYLARLYTEGMLGWDKTIPVNFVPDLVDFMIEGEEPTKENLDKKVAELQKKYGRNLDSYKTDAAGAVSETEANRKKLEELAISIGDSFRGVVLKMQTDWLENWKSLSITTNNRVIIEKELNDVLSESVNRFKQFFLEGNKTAEEFKKWKEREENTGIMYQPKGIETDKDSTTGKSLRNLENKFQMEHSDSYESWKNRNSTIKDAHGKDATGFVKEKMLGLQKALSESPLGMQYRASLYEGDATTGHAPGSPHYEGKAFDVSLYDKFAHEKILKENYPQKIRDFFHEFASEHGLTYGGDWKKPDTNHFQINRTDDNHNPQPQLQIDYDRLAHTLKGIMINHETKIVVEDRTVGGIQTYEEVNRHANSVFGGAHQY